MRLGCSYWAGLLPQVVDAILSFDAAWVDFEAGYVPPIPTKLRCGWQCPIYYGLATSILMQ
jgi:hypothetical protein